jgi:hypothetical protein
LFALNQRSMEPVKMMPSAVAKIPDVSGARSRWMKTV